MTSGVVFQSNLVICNSFHSLRSSLNLNILKEMADRKGEDVEKTIDVASCKINRSGVCQTLSVNFSFSSSSKGHIIPILNLKKKKTE